MKKLSLILALLAATMFVQAETIEHIYHFSQPVVSTQGGYQQIGFQGCLPSGMVGEPTLPWQSVSLMLPQGQEAVSVDVEFLDFVEMEGSFNLYPAQKPRPISSEEEISFAKNESLYRSNEAYPVHNHANVSTQYLNGVAFAFSGFTPVQYVPATGKVSYAQTVKVTRNNFIPSTHLYTTLIGGYYDYNPSWVLGSCDNEKDGGMVLLSEADSLNNIGQYSVAKSLYRQVVTSYPATVSAETALKSLFLLEEASGENYEVLQDYYLSDESIATNFTLSHLASSMANKCDEKMENYEEAIAWYENVLTDPETSFNDSIFAAIDLGDLYLKMEAIGMKNVCGKLMQYKPDSSIKHICRVQSALSLLPKKQMELNKNEENQPISDLEIEVLNNDKVILTWNMPEINGDMALSWITSETNDGGCTQAGFDNIFGHLYDKFDLRNHIGWRIDSISFYKTTQWTYRICVWRKYDGESMELIHSQLAHVEDSVLEEWCSVAIDTSLFIEENANYWFGVRATQEEGQTGPIFPIPFDGGPAIVGKGDLFMPDLAHWNSMGIGYNAMLKVTLNNDSMIVTNELESTIPNGYHVYRDGTLIKEIPYSFVTYFTDTEFTRETDVEYCVTAVYGNEESEAVCATAIITDVEEKLVNEGISVSPNPTNSLVRIKGTIVSDVQVYNAMGQLVKIVQNTNEVDLSGLTPGVYSLLIKDIHGININKKVVVKQL